MDPNDDTPISILEVGLNDKSHPWSAEVAAAANEETAFKQESCHMEVLRKKNKSDIAKEMKFAVMELVANEMEKMVERALDEVLRGIFHISQSGVGSVVYYVLELIMWSLFCKDNFAEMLNAHIAKVFRHRWSLRMIVQEAVYFTFFHGAYCDSARRKTDTTTEEKKHSTAVEAEGTGEYYTDV